MMNKNNYLWRVVFLVALFGGFLFVMNSLFPEFGARIEFDDVSIIDSFYCSLYRYGPGDNDIRFGGDCTFTCPIGVNCFAAESTGRKVISSCNAGEKCQVKGTSANAGITFNVYSGVEVVRNCVNETETKQDVFRFPCTKVVKVAGSIDGNGKVLVFNKTIFDCKDRIEVDGFDLELVDTTFHGEIDYETPGSIFSIKNNTIVLNKDILFRAESELPDGSYEASANVKYSHVFETCETEIKRSDVNG